MRGLTNMAKRAIATLEGEFAVTDVAEAIQRQQLGVQWNWREREKLNAVITQLWKMGELDRTERKVRQGASNRRVWHYKKPWCLRHALVITEGERQIILLALFKLKRERPGWDYAIGEIEQKLGGQLDWPEESA